MFLKSFSKDQCILYAIQKIGLAASSYANQGCIYYQKYSKNNNIVKL